MLARLLDDHSLAVHDRLAGCLLLLYAQPLTRISALRTSDISIPPTRPLSGSGAAPSDCPNRCREILRTHAGDIAEDRWLIPGRRAGSHISADALGQRLRRLGLQRAVNGRHSAMLALAGRLPAPILAQRIGIHQGRAANWARLAGATCGDYVHIRPPHAPAGQHSS